MTKILQYTDTVVFVVLQCTPYKTGTAVFKTQRNVDKYVCH